MKTLRKLFQCIFVISSLILSGTAAKSQDANPHFTLSLSAKTYEFRAGSKVWVSITRTNVSNQPIDCTEIAKNGVDVTYQYEVRDEDGNLAEKVLRPHMDTEPEDIHRCNLATGESVTSMTQISRVYKFDRPGKYVIQVSRFDPEIKDDQGNPLKVFSNTITITITG